MQSLCLGGDELIGHVTLVAIVGTTTQFSYVKVKSLELSWRSDNLRFHLQVPDLEMS